MAAPWTTLATRAFRLAWSWTDWLKPKDERPWLWPFLAQAARHLNNTRTLKKLHKQANALSGTKHLRDQALADQVLVHVLLGLIPPDPYLMEGKEIWEIHHREYRAQVLAEMADNLSRAPSHKDRRRAGEAWELEVKLLLDQADLHLTMPGGMAPFRLGIRPAALEGGQPSGPAASWSLGKWGASAPSRDKESVLARLSQESQFDLSLALPDRYPSPEQHACLEQSGREAVERALGALARAGRHDDVLMIAWGTSPPAQQPVLAAAVKALAQAGQVAAPRGLLPKLETGQVTFWALAGLASGLVTHADPRAQTILKDLLSQGAALPEGALATAAEAALGLPPEARWRVLCKRLRSGRQRGRASTLAVVAAMAPVAATLMDGLQWRKTVEKIVETEAWFGLV